MDFSSYKQSFDIEGIRLNRRKDTLYYTKEIDSLNSDILKEATNELKTHIKHYLGDFSLAIDVAIGRFLTYEKRIRFHYPSHNTLLNSRTILTDLKNLQTDILQKCDLDMERICGNSINSTFKFDSFACIEFTVQKRK